MKVFKEAVHRAARPAVRATDMALWLCPKQVCGFSLYRRLSRIDLRLRVNPRLITLSIERPVPATFVAGGAWSDRTTPFWQKSRRMRILKQCLQLEEAGRSYRESKLLGEWKSDLARSIVYFDNDGNPIDTPEKIDMTVEHYMGVFRSVKTLGYDDGLAGDPIGVAVSGDGSLVKAGNGRHRLAASHLAGLPLVPVAVKHIHEDWLAACLERFGPFPLPAVRKGLREIESRYQRQGIPDPSASAEGAHFQ